MRSNFTDNPRASTPIRCHACGRTTGLSNPPRFKVDGKIGGCQTCADRTEPKDGHDAEDGGPFSDADAILRYERGY
mgnify:CR=1 FL=1